MGKSLILASTSGLDPGSHDILFNPRFKGDLSSISLFVGLTDKFTILLVSFIGFSIMMITMIKNAIAALVAVWPKFFTKVHMLKESDGNIKNTKDRILSILPDLLAYTDFEDNPLTPREYFMKAIPLAVVNIFIGSFIFSAYYRTTIANIAGLGLHVFNRYFLSRDLVADFDSIVDEGTNYDFKFDTSVAGKKKGQIGKKLYDIARAAYGDIRSADSKAALGMNVEDYVKKIVAEGGMEEMLKNESWRFSVDVVNRGTEGNPGARDTVRDNDIQEFSFVTTLGELSGRTDVPDKDKFVVETKITFKRTEALITPASTATIGAKMSGKFVTNQNSRSVTFILPKPVEPGNIFTGDTATFVADNQDFRLRVSATADGLVLQVYNKGTQVAPEDSANGIFGKQWTRDGGTKLFYGGANVVDNLSFNRTTGESSVKLTVSDGFTVGDYGSKVEQVQKSNEGAKDTRNGHAPNPNAP